MKQQFCATTAGLLVLAGSAHAQTVRVVPSESVVTIGEAVQFSVVLDNGQDVDNFAAWGSFTGSFLIDGLGSPADVVVPSEDASENMPASFFNDPALVTDTWQGGRRPNADPFGIQPESDFGGMRFQDQDYSLMYEGAARGGEIEETGGWRLTGDGGEIEALQTPMVLGNANLEQTSSLEVFRFWVVPSEAGLLTVDAMFSSLTAYDATLTASIFGLQSIADYEQGQVRVLLPAPSALAVLIVGSALGVRRQS